jgi:hypothetical protein
LKDQLKAFFKDFQAYSVATDDSADAKVVVKFAVFIRGCKSNAAVIKKNF